MELNRAIGKQSFFLNAIEFSVFAIYQGRNPSRESALLLNYS